MFRRCLRRYQRDTSDMPIAQLVPYSVRVEATMPEYQETYHRGIHRRPILSRDLTERHAQKVADIHKVSTCASRINFRFRFTFHPPIRDCDIFSGVPVD